MSKIGIPLFFHFFGWLFYSLWMILEKKTNIFGRISAQSLMVFNGILNCFFQTKHRRAMAVSAYNFPENSLNYA